MASGEAGYGTLSSPDDQPCRLNVLESPRFSAGVDVRIGLGFTRLGAIDIIQGTFDASFLLRMCYQELSLHDNLEKRSTTDGSWKDWVKDCPTCPQLDEATFSNAKEATFALSAARTVNDPAMPAQETDATTGKYVQVDWWVKGTFYEFVELEDFPFDTQYMSIGIRNIIGGKQYNLVVWKDKIDFKFPQDCVLQEYYVYDTPLVKEVPEETSTEADEDPEYSGRHRIMVCAVIRRKSWYYVFNIVFILASISGLSFTTFFITPEYDSIADMMGITLTLFLTSIAFRFVIQDKMPKVNYQTSLDRNILVNMIVLFMVVVENIALVWVSRYVIREMTGILLIVGWAAYNMHWVVNGRMFSRDSKAWALTKNMKEILPAHEKRVVPWRLS